MPVYKAPQIFQVKRQDNTTDSDKPNSVMLTGWGVFAAGAAWEMPQPIYTGRIDAIWSTDGSGSLIGSEL